MRTILFGQFLIDRGLINADHLAEALEYQRANRKMLGELAVEGGLLDRLAILQIKERQLYEDKYFGDLAIDMSLLSKKERDSLVQIQQERHIYLGEALLALGYLNEADLDEELEAFHNARKIEEEADKVPEISIKENPAAAFFNLAAKLLPRISSGEIIVGGFYPTIAAPESDYAFSQRAEGDIDTDAILLLPDDLFITLAKTISNDNGRIGNARGQLKYERAAKSFIKSAMEIFTRKLEEEGIKSKIKVRPSKISRKAFLKRKKKAGSYACAEFLLINPPKPNGDFGQFSIGLLID